jgi:hypothetical protein
MRISEYLIWFAAAVVGLIFVTAPVPSRWPFKIRIAFRMTVAAGLFVAVGIYWLTTGEKLDETAYRIVLCRIVPQSERCLSAAADNRGNPAATSAKREGEHAEDARQRELEAERRRHEERERERVLDEARRREFEAERRRLEERERQRLVEEARERDVEEERRRQADRERQRLIEEARQRDLEAERRRLEERERQRLADEARERALEDERRRQEQMEAERRSRRFAATAVGRVDVTRSLRAVTLLDRSSPTEAETEALAQCNRVASECKIIARFSGPGKCVYVAGGTTTIREFRGVRRRTGATSAFGEAEVLEKCRGVYQSCSVFHRRCNSSL